MFNLIVLLPSSGVLAKSGWETMRLPFVLFDRKGEIQQAGFALLDALPRAYATVLVLAARDTVLLNVSLPPVPGPRLRRVLPNVVEEYLIDDAQRGHIAVGPVTNEKGGRCVAVVEREWFAGVVERFTGAGHRRLRAVPLVHCIPLPEATFTSPSDALSDLEPADDLLNEHAAEDGNVDTSAQVASALIVRHDRSTTDHTGTDADNDDAHWVEVVLRQGTLGFGVSIPESQLDATLFELAKRQPLVVHALALGAGSGQPDTDSLNEATEPAWSEQATLLADNAPHSGTVFPLVALTLPWAKLAREALACRFDLCQFEFANAGRGRPGTTGFKPWRVALGFVAASVVVSLVAVNVQWLQVRHRRDALNAQMTQLVKTAFPATTVVLDPHAQMAAELGRLRNAAGDLRPDDFPALAAGVARALGPVPSSAIGGLDYSGNTLDITFKAGTTVDLDGFKRRLAAHGLSAQEDNGKWTISSAQSGPH